MFSLRSIDDDQRVEHRHDLLNLDEIRQSLSDHLDMCRIFTDEDEEKWLDLIRRREDNGVNEGHFDLASSYQIIVGADPEDVESVISDISEEGSIDPEFQEIFGSTTARNSGRYLVENRSLFSPLPRIQDSRPDTPLPTRIEQCNCSICARSNTNHHSGRDNPSPSTTETTSGGETTDEDTHVNEMYSEIDTQIIIERESLYYFSNEDA